VLEVRIGLEADAAQARPERHVVDDDDALEPDRGIAADNLLCAHAHLSVRLNGV
jgi:hypothetical protein